MRARLAKATDLLARVVILAAIILGSNLWLVRIRDSVQSHRSVLTGQPALGVPTSPTVQQVVMIVMSGLTYDASLEMPFLNTLREQGADAQCRGHYPSYSQTAWITLISGAGPELNDAPLVDRPYDQLRLTTVDDLFVEAKRADLTTALLGFHWWERMIPEQVIDRSLFVSETDPEADEQLADRAMSLMANLPPNLMVVQFSQVSHAASIYGSHSPQYWDAVRRADSLLRDLAQAMSLTRNVLIVTSDHGYLANGGHGGADQEVIITPLVMTGGRVIPGEYGMVDQADVAPTIAALLGLAVPSAAEGEILFDALVMDEAESTEKWVTWAQQKVELSDVYLESIGRSGLGPGPKGDAEVAYSSLLVRNYGSASRLAGFAVEGATAEMVRGQAQRIASEQRRRLPVAVLPALAAAYLLWRRWTRTTAVLFICALGTLAVYHILFLWEGEIYSFSTIGTWDAFVTDSVARMGIALVPSLSVLIWLTWHQSRRTPLRIAALDYSLALLLAFLLAVPLAVSYVLNGFEVTWRLPNPLLSFVQVFSLLSLGLAAFLVLFFPLITIPVDRALRWIAGRLGSPRR
jgi:hypothetical protein